MSVRLATDKDRATYNRRCWQKDCNAESEVMVVDGPGKLGTTGWCFNHAEVALAEAVDLTRTLSLDAQRLMRDAKRAHVYAVNERNAFRELRKGR